MIPEETGGLLTDHEFFYIHDDIFDIIQYTHQEKNIILKSVSNVPISKHSQYEATDYSFENILKNNRSFGIILPQNTLQMSRG